MKRQEVFWWKGERYDSFLIIKNHDLHAGFGALFLYALNGIRLAKRINAIPVIDFNGNNFPFFFDNSRGEDVWEYFFDKISPFTMSRIKELRKKRAISDAQIQYISSEESARAHQYDRDRLATFWAWEEPMDKRLWMNEKRQLGRQYVREFIQVKTDILSKVEKYSQELLEGFFTIGIHIRGTDFAYATPVPLNIYFEAIDKLLTANSKSQYQLFLATDQQQYLQAFEEKYANKVVQSDSFRSNNNIAPFRNEGLPNYKKGEDVLIDILLLAKCQHVIKGPAATGELALWFNDIEQITDFALTSHFISEPYYKLKSTYSKFNIGKKNTFSRELHRRKESMIRSIISTRLGWVLFQKSRLARRLLKH